MNIIKTDISDVIIIKPQIFEDERGCFFESWNKKKLEEAGLNQLTEVVQWNQSESKKGVLRGLHFQKPPYSQGKLVRVVKGRVLDVAVDLRKESESYGKYVSVELSDKNKLSLWIPKGFAHGFLSLEENSIFLYGVTGSGWNKEAESGILWDDPDLNIDWKLKENNIKPILNEKDKQLSRFKDISCF